MKKIILVMSLITVFSEAAELSVVGDFNIVSESDISLTSFLSVSDDGSIVVKRDTNYENGEVSIFKYIECPFVSEKYSCIPEVFYKNHVSLYESVSDKGSAECIDDGFVSLFSNSQYMVVSDNLKLEKLWVLDRLSCQKKIIAPQEKPIKNFANEHDAAFFLGNSNETVFYIYRSRNSSIWDGVGGYEVNKNDFLKESYFSELRGMWIEHAVIAFSEVGLIGGLYSGRSEEIDLYCFFKRTNMGFIRESCHDILSLDGRSNYVYASSALSKNGKYLVVGFSNYESKEFYVRVYKVL